jgi:hypothetical protein
LDKLYWLIVGILCVWRATHLLHAEHGPGGVMTWIRSWMAARGSSSVVACFLCLSLWVAVPFAALVGKSGGERFMLWLGFSAGAILLERLMQAPSMAAPAVYFEDAMNGAGQESAPVPSRALQDADI